MHIPYEETIKHIADFKVKYRFYTEEEGGRKQLPSQGYRPDFCYNHSLHSDKNKFLIFPEFEDENGRIILEDKKQIPITGIARMWIVIPERRIYHEDKILIGTKCFFIEGDMKSAECEVIEILGLFTNPR
jgi:hypothetical protein